MLKYFISLLVLISFSAQAKEELFIYNWSDYIAEDTIENFENEFGIDVTHEDNASKIWGKWSYHRFCCKIYDLIR